MCNSNMYIMHVDTIEPAVIKVLQYNVSFKLLHI